ncbi:unnamed protein product [Paramecium octaurelia]|uniref:Transmembrane protein n=1 Tax=Paramecium octaurelia TaxID=43137 RepID=A0A8S1XS26_PAROT|nr:unnamed protein product [Paramecium octaurelia]
MKTLKCRCPIRIDDHRIILRNNCCLQNFLIQIKSTQFLNCLQQVQKINRRFQKSQKRYTTVLVQLGRNSNEMNTLKIDSQQILQHSYALIVIKFLKKNTLDLISEGLKQNVKDQRILLIFLNQVGTLRYGIYKEQTTFLFISIILELIQVTDMLVLVDYNRVIYLKIYTVVRNIILLYFIIRQKRYDNLQ